MKLLKKDINTFMEYKGIEPQPIPQMTPNKFLHICRVIYNSWKEHYPDNKWYQFDDDASDEEVYCHFKMMGADETAWYNKKDMMDSYIYGSIVKGAGYYVGGYHFEELEYGGLNQELTPVDMDNGSCIMELSDDIDLNRPNSCSKALTNIVLAYNACMKNGYYVKLADKNTIIDIIKKLYENIDD